MGSLRRLPSGRWQARYRDPSGAQRGKSFARKSDAQKFLARVEVQKERGDWVDPRYARVAVDSWIVEHQASKLNLRAATRHRDDSCMRNHVLPAFAGRPLGQIRRTDVQRWVESLVAQGLAPKTVRECYRIFSGAMGAAVASRMIANSPCVQISLPRAVIAEQRFLSPEEVERLSSAVGERYSALIYSAVYLGCRWGELVGLKREHLNLLRREVRVVGVLEEIAGRRRYVEETKTASSRRTLRIPPFLVTLLGQHLSRSAPSEFVFCGANGGTLSRTRFRKRVWGPAVSRAGLEPLRFHDLRHTCASLLIANGAHVKEIQARLGHTSVTTTLDRYGHLLPSLDEQLAERLEDTYQTARAKSDVAQMWHAGETQRAGVQVRAVIQ